MMETLLTIASVALGSSGLSAIIVAILNHRWAVKKGTSTKLDALLEAQKVLMIDRVRDLGERYITRSTSRSKNYFSKNFLTRPI